MTIGPAETAGSMPIRAKKRGEKTPRIVPTKQPPKSPIPTIEPIAAGLAPPRAPPPPNQAKRATKSQLPLSIDPYIEKGNRESGLLPQINSSVGSDDSSVQDINYLELSKQLECAGQVLNQIKIKSINI